MSERGSKTPWIIALVLGGIGCFTLLFIGALVGAVFFLRSGTSTPTPVPVATALSRDPPEETATEPSTADEPSGVDEPDAGELPAEVAVDTKLEKYSIFGSSAAELRQELNRRGPTIDGSRHDAYTRWYVRWTYPYDRMPTSCGTGPVKVSVSVTMTLPDWKSPNDAPEAVTGRWNTYLQALERHENGHKEHGLMAARAVLVKLKGLGSARDCDTMNREANEEANRVLDVYKQKDRTYDRDTRHGATQGARFP